MGSKNRHAHELLPIILRDRKHNQWYVEPFVGGCNMIDKVCGLRMGNDIHYYLISLFKSLQNGYLPPVSVSYEEYSTIMNNKDKYPPELVGFVGFGCSYSGKWFGGYARSTDNNGVPRNHCDESRRNIITQSYKIKDVVFSNVNYFEMKIPEESIIYCDPPYEGTTKYKDAFDHEMFWQWVRDMVKAGHSVFVSEYEAPKDFVSIWDKTVNNTLTKDTGSKQGMERLFVMESGNNYKPTLF